LVALMMSAFFLKSPLSVSSDLFLWIFFARLNKLKRFSRSLSRGTRSLHYWFCRSSWYCSSAMYGFDRWLIWMVIPRL